MNPAATKTLRAGLVVVAAGVGSRLGARVHKALVLLEEQGREQPLVELSLRRMFAAPACQAALSSVVLVGHADDRPALTALVEQLAAEQRAAGGDGPALQLVDGGARRQDSVQAGLAAVGDVDVVLVHDAARPFVPWGSLPTLIEAASSDGCALLATPVADTLKAAQEDPTDAARVSVTQTVPRAGLWAAQTPQAFHAGQLRELLADAALEGRTVTDEASLFEHAGRAVRIVEGSRINFKITTSDDLHLAQALLVHGLAHGHEVEDQ